MKKSINQVLLFAVFHMITIPAWAEAMGAAEMLPTTLSYPAMKGPLIVHSNRFAIKTNSLETIYINGILSGFGLWQNNPVADNPGARLELNNGQLFIQNTKGFTQFYIQTGSYFLPSLGTSYLRMGNTTHDFFGPVPIAFIKLAPGDNFSIIAGKLFTLIGGENTFTFQNVNIERGLLWNQTNAVTRGVQMNYNQRDWSGSIALSDGFYSGRLSWVSGRVIYAINSKHQLSVVASGNVKRNSKSRLVTPLAQNNSQIYNLIYSYTSGRLTLSPTLQLTHVPYDPTIGLLGSASTYGIALAAKFDFNAHWSITGRIEYMDTTGNINVAYGPGSNVGSLTLTPTYQRGIFFVRGEASLVVADNITVGSAFGQKGDNHSQGRLLIEAGVLF